MTSEDSSENSLTLTSDSATFNNFVKSNPSLQQSSEKQCGCECKEGMQPAGLAPTYIYAIGRIGCRYPNESVRQEYIQVIGESKTVGQTDPEVQQSVLSSRNNRYLAREMCWILTIDGVDCYILKPRYSEDFDLLIQSLRTSPSPSDLDIVIGTRGQIATAEMCGGRPLPIG